MPKNTFFNLPEEKREKIVEAIQKELKRASLEEISINKIVEDAKIPRGSFYQYFENKEDAIGHIIKKYIKKEKSIIDKLLEKNNGDIFKAAQGLYEYITRHSDKKSEILLYHNILEQFRRKEINTMINDDNKEEDFKLLQSKVKKQDLYIEEEQDLLQMIQILIL